MKSSHLEKAVALFDEHRQQGNGRQRRYPRELKELAVTLASQYGMSKTTTALRIAPMSFYKWRDDFTTKKIRKSPKKSTPRFVPISVPMSFGADAIEITLPNSIFLKVRPGTPVEFINDVCQILMIPPRLL